MSEVLRYLDWNDVEHSKPVEAALAFNISARTIVAHADGRVLMVKPNHDNRWDLPGGTLELGELSGQAAAREVLEETGLQVVCENEIFSVHERGFYNKISQKFYHSFVLVYRAELAAGQDPDLFVVTDTEEIKEVAWIKLDSLDFKDIHSASHQAIRKFLTTTL